MEERDHEHRMRVRYADTDQMGVVHHANYLAYFEEARTVLFEKLGASYAELEQRGCGLAVRRVELRYRAPARFGEWIRVRTRLASRRKASLTFAYEILDDAEGRLLVEGSTELACVDLRRGLRPAALPPELRTLRVAAPGG